MLAKEEWAIKRRVWAYVLTGIADAVVIAGTVVAFCYAHYAIGATLAALAVIFTLCLAGEVVQDNFYQKCEGLFFEGKFEDENVLLEQIKGKHVLFPFMRERFYIIAIRNALARDDLSLAKSYIARLRHGDDRLRHGDDRHLHYKSAYSHVLILLDSGRIDDARAEYEDFRVNNEHYAIYRPQIEVLNALFDRLSGDYDSPLPAAVTDSPYPVIKRILSSCGQDETAKQ